ncbi:MAG: hypothetical protein ABRQ38_29305 [Candidatus Eremiobacterota bacterium]
MFSKQIFSAFIVLLILLFFSVTSYSKIIWNSYSNARFGYDIEYPDILLPQEESQNGDGRKFISSDEKSILTVYGAFNTLDLSIEHMYRSTIDEYKKEGKKILYRVIDKNWFVLSGYDGDKVFYRKTMRQHQLKDDIDIDITFIMTYPKSQKSTFDKITEKISGSFCFK